jgi:hypothetical protein
VKIKFRTKFISPFKNQETTDGAFSSIITIGNAVWCKIW